MAEDFAVGNPLNVHDGFGEVVKSSRIRSRAKELQQLMMAFRQWRGILYIRFSATEFFYSPPVPDIPP